MSTSNITIVGNLTGDPEMRFTDGGSGKINFSMAVDRNWKVGDEWKTETSFFNVIAWDPVASEAARLLAKGARVMVNGRLQQRSYEKDGQKRSIVEVVADEVALSVRNVESYERRTREHREESRSSAPAAPKRTVTPSDEPF